LIYLTLNSRSFPLAFIHRLAGSGPAIST